MKIKVTVQEWFNDPAIPSSNLGEKVFDSADTVTFLVAGFSDPDCPFMLIPKGYFIMGFRVFTLDSEIRVYVGKGTIHETL